MTDGSSDIRWKQRFSHFQKAFLLLEQTIAIPSPSDAERAGLIQFFEMSFELAWKVLKDYLQEEGFRVVSPRETIKQAFQIGLISDGRVWLEALQDRNLTVHTYEEKIALAVEEKIRDGYYPVLAALVKDFNEKDRQ
ncbi:nucleotidyltransferase substrate binding protein [Desulfobulbus rhabdoformis]|uniref:nucleotidyltransferase substrate binding protein n=1 Tax=Desulfobulbus rhabdoformis TaxID=34032 RepID=UPI001964C4A5|nr:nucleotidyltransferase substrate binding protein [Desulfobulbus rhabdoformis]MBM9612712.1 nucleotidyltransferase substrate binding protein [Desulfobulbus rhabdoformis]